MPTHQTHNRPINLPLRAGVGFKPQHINDILANPTDIGWIEIHAENYMGDGGTPITQLRHMREIYPVSCHGVGLSIGGEDALDTDHLARLKHLINWLKPAQFSEHLAWSTHEGAFLNDLLPVPYTTAALTRVCDHIDQVQDTLGLQMLLENPSTYVAFSESTMAETDFLAQIATRTGCGLLLDVNNVFVSATNQNYDTREYIDAFPLAHVGEIHLGGHEEDTDDHGQTLLIDSHSRAVIDPVFDLYDYVLTQGGARPTLIEWDNDIPPWPTLRRDVAAAEAILNKTTGAQRGAA